MRNLWIGYLINVAVYQNIGQIDRRALGGLISCYRDIVDYEANTAAESFGKNYQLLLEKSKLWNK